MESKIKTGLMLLFSLLALSCGEEQELNCTFSVTPYLKEIVLVEQEAVWPNGEPKLDENGRPYLEEVEVELDVLTRDVVGYYYFVDQELNDTLTTFSQAFSGTITLRDRTTKGSDGEAQLNPSGVVSYHSLNRVDVVLVLCHTRYEMYAWRKVKLDVPVEQVLTNIRFRPEREEPYNDSGWRVVPPPVEDPL